jgi:hypothetical protein
MGSLRSLARPPIKSKRVADESVAARIHQIEFIVILERVPICMGTAFDYKHISVMPMNDNNWAYALAHVKKAKDQGKFWICFRLMAESEGIATAKASAIIKTYYSLRKELDHLKNLPWYKRVTSSGHKTRIQQIEEAFEKPLSEDLLRI